MTELKQILDDAAREGIMPTQTIDRLLPFLVARGVKVDMPSAVARPGEVPFSDTETPSFVRGFHDVLITIGIVVALAGLWGLASTYAVLPAIVVLAEILVRRQRLALPAVVLSLALAAWTAVMSASWVGSGFTSMNLGGSDTLQFTLAFPIVMGLFYLVYRVPLSLALSIMGAAVVLLQLVLRSLAWLSGDPLFELNHPGVLSIIAIVCAVGLFALAMSFDLKDPMRRTVSSDVAFWLHLGAAPALLYSVLSLPGLTGGTLSVLQTMSARTPLVVATVVALMLIGLIIDRRAFVTSGLLSLGFALYGIFRRGDASIDTYVFITLLTVGVIVLIIGTGWMPLRRFVMRRLPEGMQVRLPPA
ncbi:hypothetical protein FZ934_10355 [Rhizobium grahamii]|uniref:Uncharacterized protein n=1 Tax=Rhizobium grahamii TaxID=1120045 RepID=A0A5Q0C8U0_9HYPH|nr:MULTISPECIES: hypothetical protein [Rhizobium]QFY60784.1 hypothetical protein FZ934_10355 [Rhizobium grahamii]QRM50071.1 hypothetical protein F3Y33_12535 [Rhizobium sp. BG6]